MNDYECIIVGGGISGLAVGAILAHNHKKVLLLEQSDFLGGRYRVIEEQGCLIDYSLHLNRFADDGVAPRVFNMIDEKIDWIVSDCARIFLNGNFYPLPHSAKMVFQYPHLNFVNKIRFLKMYKSFLTADHSEYFHQSVYEYLDQNGFRKNTQIKRLIGFYCQMGLVPVNFKKISVGELMLLCKWAFLSKKPFGYPQGSWKKYLNLFQKKIDNNGKICLKSRVEKVLIEGGKAIGVRVGGETIKAPSVICAFPLQNLFTIADSDNFSAHFAKSVVNLESTAAICLDFILNKKISQIKDVICCSNPHAQGMFISNLDPSVAAEGKQLGSWLLITQPEYLDDSGTVKAKKKALKDHLETMFPSIWDHLEWERWMVLKMVNGAAPFVGQTSNLRPETTCENIKNLYFTGDTINGQGGAGEVTFDAILKTSKAVLSGK